MFTKEQLDAIRQKPEAERTQDEKEALAAAERDTEGRSEFPSSWEEVFNHPRFKQLVKRASDAESEATRLKKERDNEQADLLQKQGEYKTLYEQEKQKREALEAKVGQIDSYEQTLTGLLEAELKQLPETSRKLVPDDLSTQQKLNYIAKNRALLTKPAAPGDLGAGKRGNGPTKDDVELSAPEKELARRFGMSEKEYAKYRDSEELGGEAEPQDQE